MTLLSLPATAQEEEEAEQATAESSSAPSADEAVEKGTGESAAEENEAPLALEEEPVDAPPPLEAGTLEDTAAPSAETEEVARPQALVTRPKIEEASKEETRPIYYTPPKKVLLASAPTSDEVDRRETMPGDVVARPLTLPRGTFAFSVSQGAVFIGSEGGSSDSPAFALGLTHQVEIGLSAPLRFDQASGSWIGLEPTPHLAVTWSDSDSLELGTRVALQIPASGKTDTQLTLGIPLLVRPHEQWRFDIGVEGEFGFEDKTEISLRIPLLARAQLAKALFIGLGATPDFGLTSGREMGLDARAILGTTYQSRGRAHVELVGEFFIENIGGGPSGNISDGSGVLVRASFFPELY